MTNEPRLNLTLSPYHGDNHVTEDELRRIVTPEGTKTHRPIGHAYLLDMIRENIHNFTPYEVTETSLGVDKTGELCFGLLRVAEGGEEGSSKIIGFRNAHGKQFAAAVFCGGQVWVCSNLDIGAEHVLSRKHTSKILDFLPGLVREAIGKVRGMFESLGMRYDQLKDFSMTDVQVHDFLCQGLLRYGTVTPRSLPKVLKEWHDPSHEEFSPRTGYSLFNAFTEAYKDGKNLFFNGFTDKTLGLHRQFDELMNVNPFDNGEIIEVGGMDEVTPLQLGLHPASV